MPQNAFNLATIDQNVQGYKANAMRMDHAEKQIQREDKAYDDEQRMANTRWLAGSTKVLMDVHDNDPQQFEAALGELAQEGFRRGVLDPERFDPQLASREAIEEMHNAALVGLGDQQTDPDAPRTAKIDQFNFYRDNVAGNPEAEAMWDQSTQTDKGMKVEKISMPDGSEVQVNYDRQTGQGYDLVSGQPMIVRPGANGTQHIYGEDGKLIGTTGGKPSAAPPGFGTSQSPASKKTSELEAQRNFDSLKVAEQNLTMVENAIRLQPMMEQAISGANAWNTGWGSLLSALPASSAKDLDSTITTIKANIGFDRLQRMRAESPTGGALGQVAVQELVALQSTIANLDTAQSSDQFKDNMQIAFSQYSSWLNKWGEAIMREGTQDQQARYYDMLPSGARFMHPDGTWRVKP